MSPRVLVVTVVDATFVRRDVEVLRRHVSVRVLRLPIRPVRFAISQVLMLVKMLWFAPRSRAALVWFGDLHAVLPVAFSRLCRMRSIVVVGGYDANCLPGLRYGVGANPWRAAMVRWVYRNADYVFPVSEHMAEQLRAAVPTHRGRIQAVPTGYDDSVWFPDSDGEREGVITVGYFDSDQRIKIKGIDLLIEAARELPDVPFLIVGAGDAGRELAGPVPENVTIAGACSEESELRRLLSNAKVYAQLSITEGLPSAVCEAMLCGCVPVGSPIPGVEEAMGGHGYVLNERTASEAARCIRLALDAPESASVAVRRSIVERYSVERRESRLLSAISGD